ncbi:MAG: RtcB family protein [Clostridia bacterium]
MLKYQGKYNFANVMIDIVEPELVQQLYSMLNHPAFEHGYIAIMPDCHSGAGSCIGFTKQTNNYVIPNIVGVDISCSVESYNFEQNEFDDREFKRLENFIRREIPSGFAVRNQISKEYKESGSFKDIIEELSHKIGADHARVKRAIGTLGGGNHFIELDKDPNENIWLTIHTGSRNFGKKICEYHQNKAKNLMKEMFIGDAYKNLEFLPLEHGGQEYLDDMQIAQKYAEMNRTSIVNTIKGFFEKDPIDSIKTIHNYINFTDNVIRKGAISAHEGERVLIPLNMRDGVIVGTGKGNPKWNNSAPHGAGRVLSRTKAKHELSLDKMKEDMTGIWSESISQKTLDEAPEAYKDSQLIIDAIGETVSIDFLMKPIYNFKADEED